MWAFFRGELTRAQVQIESAVTKPMGTVVELLVVHPVSGSEWILDGEVLAVRPAKRRGLSILEIGLPGLDPALKEAFRGFIVSGRGQIQEEVSLSSEFDAEPLEAPRPDEASSDEELPERIESVVIEFEELETVGFFEDDEPTVPAHSEQIEAIPEPVVAAGSQPVAPLAPTQDEGAPPATQANRSALQDRSPPVQAEDTEPSRSTSVFAQFFAEAAEAEAKARLLAMPATRLPATHLKDPATRPAAVLGPGPSTEPTGPMLDDEQPTSRGRQPSTGPTDPMDHPEVRPRPALPIHSDIDVDESLSAVSAIVEPVTPSALPRLSSSSLVPIEEAIVEVPVQPRGAEHPKAEGIALSEAPEDRMRREQTFGIRIKPVHVDPPTTNGADTSAPALDRRIAMARARVVRRPDSINASLELSHLLSARGDIRLVDEAIDVVRKVAALAPNHPGAHHRLAELFARKGDYRLAGEHLGQAKRLGYAVDPDLERLVADAIRAG